MEISSLCTIQVLGVEMRLSGLVQGQCLYPLEHLAGIVLLFETRPCATQAVLKLPMYMRRTFSLRSYGQEFKCASPCPPHPLSFGNMIFIPVNEKPFLFPSPLPHKCLQSLSYHFRGEWKIPFQELFLFPLRGIEKFEAHPCVCIYACLRKCATNTQMLTWLM